MKAVTVQKKKNSFNKGKLKKTIKNVLCRPDAQFWPKVSCEHEKLLEEALNKYKIDIPQFEKLPWKELKKIPKEKRPKPPIIKKVDGILFGIRECYNALKNKECVAVVVDAAVNPHTIVQPVIDACIESSVPAVCLNNLRQISLRNFGIPTSCLGVTRDLLELKNNICDIAKNYKIPQNRVHNNEIGTTVMEITETTDVNVEKENVEKQCPYLYRSSKKGRVFTPPTQILSKDAKGFKEQDFIHSPGYEKIGTQINNQPTKFKPYLDMLLKKVTSNPNRGSGKKRKDGSSV